MRMIRVRVIEAMGGCQRHQAGPRRSPNARRPAAAAAAARAARAATAAAANVQAKAVAAPAQVTPTPAVMVMMRVVILWRRVGSLRQGKQGKHATSA